MAQITEFLYNSPSAGSHCRMLLACSLAHRSCEAVETVEAVEAVERCDLGAEDSLRGALSEYNLHREPFILHRWL